MLASGTRLGPYEVVAAIGAGGMGEVYRARDTRLGRGVAIKILPHHLATDRAAATRFELEARAIAALSHPNILAIFDIGTRDPHFIVTELLEGETLRARLQRGAMPEASAIAVVLQLVSGLAAAHARGIVHRDLKPENVFLTSGDVVKILDFGVAKMTDGDTAPEATLFETTPGIVIGTVGYMAPEQVRGETVDARADVFAAGAMLYEMLTGQRAFGGPTAADTLSAVLREQPPDHSAMTPALSHIVKRCLAKTRVERFQSATELKHALEPLLVIEPASRHRARPDHERSIAVLPFDDLSASKDQAYFCEGMADEIIAALSGLDGLRVASRTSAVRCREKGWDIAEIGRHLNVQTVLEGSVRTASGRVRVTAQLTSVADGYQLWAERFDRPLADVFAIQDEIAGALVEKLKVRPDSSARERTLRRTPDNPEAYKLYLEGRYNWERRSKGLLKAAQTCFQRAIAAAPEYALPHAGLADCYLALGAYGVRPGIDVMPLALASAERARALDDSSAEAYHALGAVKTFLEWDTDGADRAFARALDLNPRLAISAAFRAINLAHQARFDEASGFADLAVDLEPDSAHIAWAAAAPHIYARSFDRALALLDRAIALEETSVAAHWLRSWALVMMGRADAAIDAAEHAVHGSNRQSVFLSSLGSTSAAAGRLADAEAIIAELTRRRDAEYIAPLHIADVYAALGDAAAACNWLEQAFSDRNGFLVNMGVGPFYDRIRDHPRFRALLRRVNPWFGDRPPLR